MKYTRVTDICLSRLIIIFIAQSYINSIQTSVGIIFLLATRITIPFTGFDIFFSQL